MNALKRFCQFIVQVGKQAGSLPKAIANCGERRRRQTVLNEREAERLDRIRSPWKYRGR